MHSFTDQPIRWVAVFAMGPILTWRGIVSNEPFVVTFAVALMAWDGFCILFRSPVQLTVPTPLHVHRELNPALVATMHV